MLLVGFDRIFLLGCGSGVACLCSGLCELREEGWLGG